MPAQPKEKQQPTSLYTLYNSIFEVVRADTPELRQEAFRLRYQVYCVENPFEDPANNPSGVETDAYDAHAIHYLLRYRPANLTVGTVRMVLPVAENLQASFPIQSVCDLPLLKDPEHVKRSMEISRFSISQVMRKRVNDTLYSGVHIADAVSPEEGAQAKRRVLYHAALGLIQAVNEVIEEHEINDAYLICEPTLHRILGLLGICITPMGPFVEYHGRRQPVRIDDIDTLRNTKVNFPHVWEIISDLGRLHRD